MGWFLLSASCLQKQSGWLLAVAARSALIFFEAFPACSIIDIIFIIENSHFLH